MSFAMGRYKKLGSFHRNLDLYSNLSETCGQIFLDRVAEPGQNLFSTPRIAFKACRDSAACQVRPGLLSGGAGTNRWLRQGSGFGQEQR